MKIQPAASATLIAVSFVLGLTVPMLALAASPGAVNLGTAGNYVILTKAGVSTTGATSVVGDIGVSPVAASYITGFALTLPAASAFSTSAIVTGKVYASDYANPTPSNLTTAVLDMQTAYTDAAGRAADVTELGAGNIGGMTLAPGVYKWGTGVTIPTDVTLSGSANDVWIFQIAQGLNVSSGTKIILSGGAQARNVFWVVAGQTTIGTTAVVNGNILDQTAIVLNTGATLNGKALAQTAVTLDSNDVTIPSGTAAVVVASKPTPTPAPASSSGTSSNSSNNTNTGGNSNSTGTANTSSATTGVSAAMPSASLFGQQVRAIAVNIGKGSNGTNVSTLQQFLISQNKGSAARSLSSVGATGYFGVLTRAALAEFQSNVGISPALGNFGPITRAYIGAH